MRRRLMLAPYAFIVLVALGLVGCGVAAANHPFDEGEPAAPGPGASRTETRNPPGPDAAEQADDLVRNFLQTAAGGSTQAIDRSKQYLTGTASDSWAGLVSGDNPPLMVVRIVSGPTMATPVVSEGVTLTPVSLTYQPVGVLTDRGRIDSLANLETRALNFSVVADEQFKIRIAAIDGWPAGQLLLSDEGLTEYYQMQPIYFWDTEYKALVPDLRYVPWTISSDSRASARLTWLTQGPSSWVAGVQNLPAGTTGDRVLTTEGRQQVKLSAAALPPDDDDAARHLMYQLMWSLSDEGDIPQIDLYIDNQLVPVEIDDREFRASLNSWSFREPQLYDIQGGVVETIKGGERGPLPTQLSVPENTAVVAAAVSRDQARAALVQEDQLGRPSLHLVADGQSHFVDLQLPPNASLGRPSFVPGADLLLVPTGGPGGRLQAVSTQTGAVTGASGTLPGLSAAVVSPDGRRVAVIVDGEVSVAPLSLDPNGTVSLSDDNSRHLLAGLVTATAVTWTSESWLLVAGQDGNGQPALWRVTADSVVARNRSADLSGPSAVTDLVAWPAWTVLRNEPESNRAEVFAVTDLGVYRLIERASPAPEVSAPFFG
jgi:hypothetical protein